MSRNKKIKGEDLKQEDILQAVVLADSFNIRFSPVTQTKPRALLPLVNVPLIEYTLECLCTSGIQEVIVFCCIHAEQMKQYIKNSRWNSDFCTMEVVVVVSEGCMSTGDVLREIDSKSLIASDFILINGDMVSNIQLLPLLQAHKQRRLKEKTPVMTMLFKNAPPDHTSRCVEDDIVMAVEKGTDRVLSYQKVGTSRKFDFPLELFEGRTEVNLRFDLLDTQISICSPLVSQLFTDNFDYLTREDFVKGILDNEEILGNTIHIHVLEDEYAARVSNLQMYEAVSKDVICRWSYPMVPDKNITDHRDNKYSHGRHNIYLHSDVTLARGCILQENVVIGKDSYIGSNTKISHSVIGKNVKIGENVVINGAYVWDNCSIGDNCEVKMCILDNNVQLKNNVTVKSGCVLAKNVIVGPQIVLNQSTSLVATKPNDDFGEEEESTPVQVDVSVIGTEGHGYLYEAEVDSDDEMEDLVQGVWGMTVQSEAESDSGLSSSEDSGEEGLEEGADDDELQEGAGAGVDQDEDSTMFFEDVISTLERGLKENIGTDNLILEINSAKSAYGIYIKEVNIMLTKAVLELPFGQNPELELAEYFPKIKANFKKFLPLLRNYIKSSESQSDLLSSLEDCCVCNDTISKSVAKVLHFLYEAEILTEETLIKWHKTAATGENKDTVNRMKKADQLVKFIQWLEEAEEESDSDEG